MTRSAFRLCALLFTLSIWGLAIPQTRPVEAFQASGTSCEQVKWSENAVKDFPDIRYACREVLSRDGVFMVRVECGVRRVALRGREVTVQCDRGVTFALSVPDGVQFQVADRRIAARELKPGDPLEFFIPQDELIARFSSSSSNTEATQRIRISPPPSVKPVDSQLVDLPRTGSNLGVIALIGTGLVLLAGVLLVRRRHRRSGGDWSR